MEQRRKVWTKKRPIAVTIVALGIVVLLLLRLFQVFEPLVRMRVLESGVNAPLLDGMRPTPVGAVVLTSAGHLVLSVIGIVLLIGFLAVRRWAWVVLMAWTGISLLMGLIEYFYGDPNYAVMAANAIIALALNQVEVQRIFQIRIEQVDHGL
jgi:hypothetical protein